MSFIIDNISKKLEILTDKCAVVYDGQSFTYADLQRRYKQLLSRIQSIEINQNNATIVLLMRRSFDLLAAMIAIWESGTAYVPIDPNTPPERIQYILDNTTPSCIISEPAYLEKLATETLPILTFQDVREAKSVEQSFPTIHSRLKNRSIGEQIAYVIYTSGSTGHPKGVMVSHANVSNHINWLVDKFNFSEKDIISFNSSIAFDFSVACTLLPLSIGAKIVITTEENTLNIPYYCQQLTQEQVTFVKWTPSYFKLVLNYAEQHHPDLSSLRLVMLGGEEVLTTYVNRWLSIYPNHTLINEYGPTEAAVGITTHAVTQATLDKTEATVPIGQKAINSDLYVVDKNYQPVKIGEIGELLIGGNSVAKGYIKNARLTEEKFIKVPSLSTTQTLYKTGDLVKQQPDGNYVYVGRIDTQVKINGYRVEISEIEHFILAYPGIKQVVVHPEKHPDQAMTHLTAYLLLENNRLHPDTLALKKYLSNHIPTFMIPEKYFIVSHIPMNRNRKVDYHRIKDHIIENKKQKIVLEDTHDVFSIKKILKSYLSVENIDMKKTFFDLGITSLLAIQIINDINQKYQKNITIQDLFTYSTPLALDNFIKHGNIPQNKKNTTPNDIPSSTCHESIAIIAMDCRLPMAENCEELWKLCQEANEAIHFFNQEDVDAVHDDRVYARGTLNDIDKFDAAFFNISPKEAKMMDPQHRLLLESVWTALEKAGYIPGGSTRTQTGVYVSMNDSTYLLDQHIQSSLLEMGKRFALQRLISPQFLATKIAYHLNLTGPAISLQTACSSSLAAVVLACQQLSAKDCNMAIAGGISLITPQDLPYHYQQGNILSPDGHCRPFDASANGTVFSNGLGIVVLKRLSDAQRDNDNIAAIIRGYAMNNDGHDKMSYAAPSLQGQLSCILSAQSMANINAESIQYIETHGTGTLVGDPIEMAALTKAFQQQTHKQQYCAIGSLKANIGHTHVAAGVTGLIKTVLALKHKQIPPMLHYKEPNPNIDFPHSPFYVNTRLQRWESGRFPRRAAVSAFGVGGTNAHVILDESPITTFSSNKRTHHLLLLSANTADALLDYHHQWIGYFNDLLKDHKNHPTMLADIAYTVQHGRKSLPHRVGIVCDNINDAIEKLSATKSKLIKKAMQPVPEQPPKIVFLFPGQGTQYINLSKTLYHNEPIYRTYLDRCFDKAKKFMNDDLKSILFYQNTQSSTDEKLYQTAFTHPILFSIEYALAKLLEEYGILPDIMLGHSLGEYVAACLAGVMSLDDAIKLVCTRGKAIANCPKGGMLAVSLTQKQALTYCQDSVALAAINASDLCVLSGTKDAITQLEKTIKATHKHLSMSQLKCDTPFHNDLLSAAMQPLQDVISSISFNTPTVPYFSNLTGNWITDSDVSSPNYWTDHMRKTVNFYSCVKKLTNNENTIFIEVGPGKTLLSLIQREVEHPIQAISLLPSFKDHQQHGDQASFEKALKNIWMKGGMVKWENYYQQENRCKVSVPTYPFQRKRYWIDQNTHLDHQSVSKSHQDILFYAPTWRRLAFPIIEKPLNNMISHHQWIILTDQSMLCQQLIEKVKKIDDSVTVITIGKNFTAKDAHTFSIDPSNAEHYTTLLETALHEKTTHLTLLHCWLHQDYDSSLSHEDKLLNHAILQRGLHSGLLLTQALNNKNPDLLLSYCMVTTQLHTVIGNETIHPLKSTLLGFGRVVPLENQKITVKHIDVDMEKQNDLTMTAKYVSAILETATKIDQDKSDNTTIAFRHGYQWHLVYQPIALPKTPRSIQKIRPQGVYLITGGLGGMGLTIADGLAKQVPVTLLLLSRRMFPAEETWPTYLTQHDADDATSQIIKKLMAIREQGSCPVVLSSDLTNYDQLSMLLSKTQQKYGRINGVFHLAGIPGKGLSLLKRIEMMQAVLSPKIVGTYVLHQLLKDTPLDFVLFASSLTAIAGGVGQIDYCAANLFLDYFLSTRPFKHCQYQGVINWNAWRTVGMASALNDSKIHAALYEENSISPSQGMTIINAAINTSHEQIIVSHIPPEQEIRRIRKTFQNKENKRSSCHDSTAIQKDIKIAVQEIWQDILGVETINHSDTFYSLGGDSLLAIQLLNALNSDFNVKLTLQELAYPHTLHSLIKLITYQPIASNKAIIPLFPDTELVNNHDTTVYFVHPLGGTVLCYFPLANYLEKGYRYYTIQDPELNENQMLFDSISDISHDYANKILAINDSAQNIILVGASFGGNIAVEIANRLKTNTSKTVKKIILIDSWANLSKTDFANTQLKSSSQISSLTSIKEYYGENSERYHAIQRRLNWLRQYTPSRIQIPTVILKAHNLLPLYAAIDNEYNGWRDYCDPSIKKYTIPGNHDTMLSYKYIPALAEKINALLKNNKTETDIPSIKH